MKLIKILTVVLLSFALILTAGYLVLRSQLSPTYAGQLLVAGLENPAEVYYSEYGIPHIYANTEKDALFALGYIQAQDRLWQMDLVRHVGSGRLSEIFGKDLVKSDKYLRTFGLNQFAQENATKFLKSADPALLALCQSYLDGINSFIENNPKTLEHLILGVEVEPFTIENLYHVNAYMAFGFAMAQKTDPFLTQLAAKLDSTYLNDLPIYHVPGQSTIPNHDLNYVGLSNDMAELTKSLPVPLFHGSNGWVVSPEKSKTGGVILVNDPHIGFSQPSVWFEAHIATPTKEYYGYFLPGLPFAPIVHSTSHAIGMTMFENDDIDFYIEKTNPENPNQYLYKNEWQEIASVTEVIKVKGEEQVEFVRRSTKHGPIVTDILEDSTLDETVSMYWVLTQQENQSLETISTFSEITTPEKAQKQFENITAPGLNILYGNSKGDIGWWAVGKLIYRENEQSSKFFRPGHDGTSDPDSMRDFSQNPKSINPPRNYVQTANQQPEAVNGVYYSGYYTPEYRGKTIDSILINQEKFDVEDMKKMLLNTESDLVTSTKSVLLEAIADQDKEFINYLASWNNSFTANAGQGVFFARWHYNILKLATKDEMGDKLWTSFLEASHLFKRTFKILILTNNSVWWDDVATETIETRSDIIAKAYTLTQVEIAEKLGEDYTKWRWEDAHQVTHPHILGANALLAKLLNVGPYSLEGSNEVINNTGYPLNDNVNFDAFMGPSTRRIIDFNDVRNNSWSILPTGQSGNLFSPYYADQAELYANGGYRKMMMNEDEIKSSGLKLVLVPKP